MADGQNDIRETEDIASVRSWWSPKGAKMRFDRMDYDGRWLRLANGSVAELTITHAEDQGDEEWRVIWHVYHTWNGSREFSSFSGGQRYLTTMQLMRAFGETEGFERAAGMYVRDGKFLNIPNKGEAYQGDANISVFITKEIVEGVRSLVRLPRT